MAHRGPRRRLSTRLLLLLLPTVATVMMVYAAWALVQPETTLLPAARLETRT